MTDRLSMIEARPRQSPLLSSSFVPAQYVNCRSRDSAQLTQNRAWGMTFKRLLGIQHFDGGFPCFMQPSQIP